MHVFVVHLGHSTAVSDPDASAIVGIAQWGHLTHLQAKQFVEIVPLGAFKILPVQRHVNLVPGAHSAFGSGQIVLKTAFLAQSVISEAVPFVARVFRARTRMMKDQHYARDVPLVLLMQKLQAPTGHLAKCVLQGRLVPQAVRSVTLAEQVSIRMTPDPPTASLAQPVRSVSALEQLHSHNAGSALRGRLTHQAGKPYVTRVSLGDIKTVPGAAPAGRAQMGHSTR